ncbi:restriction endonuclease subunit S, partial [Vibrio cholerae]
MGNDWPLVKLGDFVQILTGHPFKSKDYSEHEGIRLLRGDNIAQGTLRWQNVKLLPQEKIGEKEHNYFLRTGDVILAMDRPWIEAGLKTAQINENDLPCLLVQRVACLRCEDPSDQDFIRYIISSYGFVQYVKLIQTGTAVPHISGKQIKDYEFRLPPKSVRKQIGRIVKQLDDKANLNRQINQTLEQMAQTLFKSWFVDFDP